jgi:hypothetical protein
VGERQITRRVLGAKPGRLCYTRYVGRDAPDPLGDGTRCAGDQIVLVVLALAARGCVYTRRAPCGAGDDVVIARRAEDGCVRDEMRTR